MDLLVLDLAQVGRRDVAVAGGKGANLGELARARFPVPAGFVLTTAAYDHCIAHNDLGGTIVRALDAGSRANGAVIRAAFEQARIPPEVEQACLAAYDRLGRGAVAVRSSATAEDLPGAAFAGQQESFLNVEGVSALLDAVRRCWASLWGERAIAYRLRLGMDQQTVKLAVVVQRLVNAEVAGVLFTANPIHAGRRETVIEASPGLGEAVVSGLVTSDRYILRKAWWGWKVVEQRPGRRELRVRPRAGGGTEHVSADPGAVPASLLPRHTLRRLARRAWLAELQAFLDRYGHREAAVATASLPTWRDAPEIALGIVKGLALEPPRPSAGPPAWERARGEVLASARWVPRPAFLALLRTARTLLQVREDTHFYATLALPPVRRTVLEMGGRLVQVGALERAEDVFHLTLGDLQRLKGAWPPPASLAT